MPKAGKRTKKLSSEFYAKIGSKGGRSTAKQYGRNHFIQLSKKRKTFGAGPGRPRKKAT